MSTQSHFPIKAAIARSDAYNGFDQFPVLAQKRDFLTPTTRISLIYRIRSADDVDAWSQFVEIYGPLVHRYGMRKGLQDADATDLVQDVLTEVCKSIQRFDYDPKVGRFRNWFFVIARRTLASRLRNRHRQVTGSGDTRTMNVLSEHPSEQETDRWEMEYQQYVFSWASNQVRNEFREKTWHAFWHTSVDGIAPSEVAQRLGMSIGAVYVAKNRVITRLREKIRFLDDSIEI